MMMIRCLALCAALSLLLLACTSKTENAGARVDAIRGTVTLVSPFAADGDSIQITLDKQTGRLLQYSHISAKGTTYDVYGRNGALRMRNRFESRGKGVRTYFDTSLIKEAEGPVRGLDKGLEESKTLFFRDGKHKYSTEFMTRGVTDSTHYFDSATQMVVNWGYAPHVMKTARPDENPNLQRTKRRRN